ncbi:MAG: glycosyltransferase [Spirochaetaceae bacterium]|nr:MAG: glycosyltransferase [Spirochaetaceae bacterium]
MQQNRIVVLSPPFYSHFGPLMALSRALRDAGAEVIAGCTRDFEAQIRGHGLGFAEVQINRNANTGQAEATRQAEHEQRRLREFLAASEHGPIETLRTQTRHRFDDMLANPEELLQRVKGLQDELQPQLWIVDQLSYGATLALVAHRLRFVTFCPPHPLSIPAPDAVYGVPTHWPQPFAVDTRELTLLHTEALALQQRFTRRFNQLLAPYNVQLPNAFAATSPELVIHNYPEFERPRPQTTRSPERVYCGYSFVPADDIPSQAGLPPDGAAATAQDPALIVIALGTFLSARGDVLSTLARKMRHRFPAALIAVGAGQNVDTVREAAGQPSLVEPFIEQRRLLREAGLFIHHGGVSSFTEALYYGVPMIVLPFSSDQFNVAADVQRNAIGAVLNPNRLSDYRLDRAIRRARAAATRRTLAGYTAQVRSRGPAFAAAAIMQLLRVQ